MSKEGANVIHIIYINFAVVTGKLSCVRAINSNLGENLSK